MSICCGAIQLRNLKAVAHEAKRSVFQIDDVHMHVHAGESCMKRADSPDIFFFFFLSAPQERRKLQPKLFKCSFAKVFHARRDIPQNKLRVAGQMKFLRLIF